MNKGELFNRMKDAMQTARFSEAEVELHLQHYTEKFSRYTDAELEAEISSRGGEDAFIHSVLENRNHILMHDASYCEAVGISLTPFSDGETDVGKETAKRENTAQTESAELASEEITVQESVDAAAVALETELTDEPVEIKEMTPSMGTPEAFIVTDTPHTEPVDAVGDFDATEMDDLFREDEGQEKENNPLSVFFGEEEPSEGIETEDIYEYSEDSAFCPVDESECGEEITSSTEIPEVLFPKETEKEVSAAATEPLEDELPVPDDMPTVQVTPATMPYAAMEEDGATRPIPHDMLHYTDMENEDFQLDSTLEDAEPVVQKRTSALMKKTYFGEASPEAVAKFRRKAILTSPFWGLVSLICVGSTFLLYLASILLIPALLLLMLAFCVGGVVVTLVGTIYGTSQVFIVRPAGLYEIGLGLVALGLTIVIGTLIYNLAVRVVPKLVLLTWQLVKNVFWYVVDLYRYYRGECYRQ